MAARCIMVWGTSSGAGKSWLVTALCRWYARQGLKVAPFKAQNMSNNARVVASQTGLGEIGSAQYFQALAAQVEPRVCMNPVLLKPEADTRSQVVLLGEVNQELSRTPWRERSDKVWPAIAASIDALRATHDVVVIEGAGSPAEINLMASDVVNLRVAKYADARCLLVTDIDRGGAFAHLYGTWALLPPEHRARVQGFVLNKFRGDPALLAPAPEQLQALTGVPTVGTLPMWWHHGLPEEDCVFDDRSRSDGGITRTVAVVAYPHISNLDEFQPLKNIPGVRLSWVRSAAEVAGLQASDWVILPGSKLTSGDLAWMRTRGVDAAVAQHVAKGGAVLGICGGLQMLGEALIDPHGIDGNAAGLGLLPLVTVFDAHKTVRRTQARLGALLGPWQALSGVTLSGYEIHHGQTRPHAGLLAKGEAAHEVVPDLAWQSAEGRVLGLYVHGLFESPAVLQALFGVAVPTLETVMEGLADFIDQHLDRAFLQRLLD